jgi:hypothetical protein
MREHKDALNIEYIIPRIVDYGCWTFPLTDTIYNEHSIHIFGDKYNNRTKSNYPYTLNCVNKDAAMIVNDLPAMLINLGLLFGKLVGPRYIKGQHIDEAYKVLYKAQYHRA